MQKGNGAVEISVRKPANSSVSFRNEMTKLRTIDHNTNGDDDDVDNDDDDDGDDEEAISKIPKHVNFGTYKYKHNSELF